MFLTLLRLLQQLHHLQIVVGDLNCNNLICRGPELHLIDFDSVAIARYPCFVGLDPYVDPLVLRQVQRGQADTGYPYSSSSDYYAFATLLFEALMGCHPRDGFPFRQFDELLVEGRHWVFDRATTKLPCPPLSWLDRELAGWFETYFTTDKRPTPSPRLLEQQIHRLGGKSAEWAAPWPFITPPVLSLDEVAVGTIRRLTLTLGSLGGPVFWGAADVSPQDHWLRVTEVKPLSPDGSFCPAEIALELDSRQLKADRYHYMTKVVVEVGGAEIVQCSVLVLLTTEGFAQAFPVTAPVTPTTARRTPLFRALDWDRVWSIGNALGVLLALLIWAFIGWHNFGGQLALPKWQGVASSKVQNAAPEIEWTVSLPIEFIGEYKDDGSEGLSFRIGSETVKLEFVAARGELISTLYVMRVEKAKLKVMIQAVFWEQPKQSSTQWYYWSTGELVDVSWIGWYKIQVLDSKGELVNFVHLSPDGKLRYYWETQREATRDSLGWFVEVQWEFLRRGRESIILPLTRERNLSVSFVFQETKGTRTYSFPKGTLKMEISRNRP